MAVTWRVAARRTEEKGTAAREKAAVTVCHSLRGEGGSSRGADPDGGCTGNGRGRRGGSDRIR